MLPPLCYIVVCCQHGEQRPGAKTRTSTSAFFLSSSRFKQPSAMPSPSPSPHTPTAPHPPTTVPWHLLHLQLPLLSTLNLPFFYTLVDSGSHLREQPRPEFNSPPTILSLSAAQRTNLLTFLHHS